MCLEERELKRSHILPDFAGRWLKDTSATGYLRYSGAPNKRHQDTERLYLFCEPCEQRLSVWERKFRLEVFTKIVNDEPKPYRYGPWLLLFGVSVCWRAALLARPRPQKPRAQNMVAVGSSREDRAQLPDVPSDETGRTHARALRQRHGSRWKAGCVRRSCVRVGCFLIVKDCRFRRSARAARAPTESPPTGAAFFCAW